MTVAVDASIRHLGSTYADGTPRLEIHVPLDAAEGLPFALRVRVPITLRIDGAQYQAGLRATSPSKLVWISPDMRAMDGGRITLRRVLINAGFGPDD